MARILVIRDDEGFSHLLRAGGHEVLNLPLTRTERLEDLSELKIAIKRLAEYDAVFFTSPAAAEVFAEETQGLSFTAKIYVLGERAAAVLEKAGMAVERHDANTADGLLDDLGDERFAGQRVLFVRGERSMRTIPNRLSRVAGIDEAAVYRTVETESEVPTDRHFDWVCFFSPSGVEAFAKRADRTKLNGIKAAVIGTTTARAAEEHGFEVGYIAERATADDLAEGLKRHIEHLE